MVLDYQSKTVLTYPAVVLALDLSLTADEALEECRRRGLVVASERALAGREASRHWHLRLPDRPGTLELTESEQRVSVKVHPRRTGDWAQALARDLAAIG
jgi:hypothetical protein